MKDRFHNETVSKCIDRIEELERSEKDHSQEIDLLKSFLKLMGHPYPAVPKEQESLEL